MASKGAKNLILLSRSGSSSQAAKEVLAELTKAGVHAIAPQCDVSSRTSLSTALEECGRTMPSIKGCINGAMVLQVSLSGFIPVAKTVRLNSRTGCDI
jgi:NAD(P)-dependent dehydrogenase (short-subunit alcohol dehydrogenase family)